MGTEYHVLTKVLESRVVEVLRDRGYSKNRDFGDKDYVKNDRSFFLEIQKRETTIDERLRLYGPDCMPYPSTILIGDVRAIAEIRGLKGDLAGLQTLVSEEFRQIGEILSRIHKTEVHQIDCKEDNVDDIISKMISLGIK